MFLYGRLLPFVLQGADTGKVTRALLVGEVPSPVCPIGIQERVLGELEVEDLRRTKDPPRNPSPPQCTVPALPSSADPPWESQSIETASRD